MIFDDTYRTPPKGGANEVRTGVSFLRWLSLLSIIGGFILGCVTTVANHFVFAYFNGKRSDQFPQFWVTVMKNIIPKIAQVAWATSLSCSVAQTVCFLTSFVTSFDALNALNSQRYGLSPRAKRSRCRDSTTFFPAFTPSAFYLSSCGADLFCLFPSSLSNSPSSLSVHCQSSFLGR